MKVAVTGATGFVGGPVCAALASAGHEPVPVARNDPMPGSCEALVHLAAIAHRHASDDELAEVNVRLAGQRAREAAALGARVLFLSSVKVHGEETVTPFSERSPFAPMDPYARSKARAEEMLCAIPQLHLAVLRPPLVYGPGVKANFLALMRALARGWPLPLASVDNRRSLIYVGNLADAIVRALGTKGTYLVSDGAAPATPQLCREIAAALGRPARLWRFPPSLLPRKIAASLEIDDSAIRTKLGWQPRYTRHEGLQATADWYRRR